jgi:hypothetical protein
METHRIPATWAMSDPAHSPATSRILMSNVPHEFAILGDANWLGPATGRTRFARELSDRLLHARSLGLSVQTLVPRVASIESDVDLIVKQHITAVAGLEGMALAGTAVSSPRALHFGVWEIPVTGKLPSRAGWFSSAGRSTWRRVRDAAKDSALIHLMIDAPSLCDDFSGQKWIAWLMRRIANLRDRGLVRIETLRATAARLSDVPVAKPQRSILRSAA